MKSILKRKSTRASNLLESFINTSLEKNSSSKEDLQFQLPQVVEREIVSGLSLEECKEKIEYSKERSDHYLREFNRPGALEVEREWFQKQCEWYVNRIFIYETVLERLTGGPKPKEI